MHRVSPDNFLGKKIKEDSFENFPPNIQTLPRTKILRLKMPNWGFKFKFFQVFSSLHEVMFQATWKGTAFAIKYMFKAKHTLSVLEFSFSFQFNLELAELISFHVASDRKITIFLPPTFVCNTGLKKI